MIVFGDDIVQWVHERMPESLGFSNPIGIGIINNNRLMGGVVYDNYRPDAKNISVSIAIDCKKCLTRYNITKIFEYAFNSVGCNRINAMILKSNNPSLDLCRRLGFVQEGILRQASMNSEDVVILGFLKSEFKQKWQKSSKHTLAT